MKPQDLLRSVIPALVLSLVGCAPQQVTAPATAAASPDETFGNAVPSEGPKTATVRADQDPAITDGDKYHVILDNKNVRVFRYSDKPGDKTHQHHHLEFVLYALSSFRRKLTFPDGTSKERDFVEGDVIWMPEQTHIGENTGTTNTEVLLVELKRP